MWQVDQYRDPQWVSQLLDRLHAQAGLLNNTRSHPFRIMEVCGGHTHAIFRFGLDKLLPQNIEFVHGPGCPVCVLPMGRIDSCIEIANYPQVIFCSFGDALRVPGKTGTLMHARSRGADVRIIYSPMDALQLARKNPDRIIVLFALGFETTMPATAITLQQARATGITNFYCFCQHITLAPTLRSLLSRPDTAIDAFLAPGHVSMITGITSLDFICSQYRRPLVIAGFEPVDVLQSVLMLIEQKIHRICRVENQYKRVVPAAGNRLAQRAMEEVFTLNGGSEWRGLGLIEGSRIRLTDSYAQFDAESYFHPAEQQVSDDPRARCGDVLTGRCKPVECSMFGSLCNPQHAVGALMVSSEGACAAWYQYRHKESVYEES